MTKDGIEIPKIGCVQHDCDECRKRAAQPAPVQEPVQEPVAWINAKGDMTDKQPEAFEQWNAKQHGDPEEIGFLQALRIAYCAGQDSVTKATPPAAQRQPLTDADLEKVFPAIATYHEANKALYRSIARIVEAAHEIKENT